MDIIRLGVKIALPIYSIIKKALLVFIVFYIVISAFMYFLKEDRPKINYQQRAINENAIIYEQINDPELKKTDAGQIQIALYRGFMCSLFGEACTEKQADAPKYRDHSLFGRVTGWVAAPYSVPPASGLVWLQDSFQNAGFIPSAYAAEGVGFSSIKGYITLWKLFRNIAFLVLVVIMLVIGFFIMFRVPVEERHVITIESILPRVVVTMIFISMSFAIAGFLIDMMYTLIGVSVSLIMGYGQGADKAAVLIAQDDFIGAKFHDLWPTGFGLASPFGVGSALWDMIPLEFKAILSAIVIPQMTSFFARQTFFPWDPLISATSGAGIEGLTFGGNIGQLFSGPLKWIAIISLSGMLTYILPGLLLGLIIILTILLLMFRLFFMLLSSYIKVILYVIFAPLIILMEVFPGQRSFMWWFRNLMGELIVFPTVVIIMLAGNAVLTINTGSSLYRVGEWGTSLNAITKPDSVFVLPFLYGFNPADFNMIVALGIILLTPDFIKIVKQWVGAEGMPIGLGIGTFLAGGTMVAKGTFGGLHSIQGLQSSLVGEKNHKGLSGMGGPIGAIASRLGGAPAPPHA